MATEVKVSSRYQIVIPRLERKKLGIVPGEALLVQIENDALVLFRKPSSYSDALRGLHKDLWKDVDPAEYIAKERKTW